MRRFALLAMFGLALTPGFALAQDAPNSPAGGHCHHPGGEHGGWGPGPGFINKFYAANTTHDDHLTLAQAKAGELNMVVAHFNEIDTQHRGYVTFNDVQAWHLDDVAKHLEQKADQLRAQD